MLYIFHVDTGTMMTFDMNLAMENVAVLQTVIARVCHISEDKQVLLISGGESLDPSQRVAKYSAGTDTNPIFLFSKTTIEAATPPSPSIHYGSDIDLQGQVEGSLLMPPAYDTVVSRTQLAVQFRDVDDEEMKACEHLVHDQHLQQQGWAAVVANLEDITSALGQRWDLFQESYNSYLTDRQTYLSTLSSVGESLDLLSKIPLLPCLSAPVSLSLSHTQEVTDALLSDDPTPQQCKTLFEWISSQDPQHSLHDMVEQCLKATEQFDEKILDTLNGDVQQTIEAVNNPNMKEVKGLEDRLYGLDQFMSGARKIVQEQADMAKGFVQNQNRVTNLRDNSILPDLCASHKKQLVVMLNNHKRLRDIKKKCRMAKEELSVNLHTRLRWVMFVEKKICDVDSKLMIYRENLKRLQKRLDILRQIYEAPRVYAELVVEVVRRRKFSTQFLEWATGLALESSQLHAEEVKRRQMFLSEIGKHFLQSLFQGFEDTPPVFAMEAPAQFDRELPPITDDDIQMLRDAVPELAEKLSVPNVAAVGECMTLHTMMSSVSDSTVQCDATVCRSIPGTLGTSAATSDIDIIQSHGDHQFVHIDNSNLSLKDQVAACEPHTDIKIKPSISVIADKPNFPVPQSLSETLTQEMRSQSVSKKISQSVDGTKTEKMSDSGDALQSSGEPTKSSDSDIGSVDRSRESLSGKKPRVKGQLAVDTSPEMETSQEFTTADFYIDESMPSSMTDSPPNKQSGGDKVTISQQLVEKTQSVAKLEKELNESQRKLTNSEKYMNHLQVMLKEDVPRLRQMFFELREGVVTDRHNLREYVDSSVKNINQTLTLFHNSVVNSHEESLASLNAEHVKDVNLLKDEISVLEKNKSDLVKRITELQTSFESTVAELETCKTNSEKELMELKKVHDESTEDLIRKHALESEVELDKVQSDFKAELDQYDSQVRELTEKLGNVEKKMQEDSEERKQKEQLLRKQFEEEKQTLRSSVAKELEEEFKVKEKQRLEQVQSQTEKIHEEKVKKLKDEHGQEMKKEVEKCKKEKQKELVKQKEELETNNRTIISELTEKFGVEKAEELKKLQEDLDRQLGEKLEVMEKEHGEKVSQLQKMFAAERSELEQQIKQLQQLNEMSSTESQTEDVKVMTLSQHRQELDAKQKELQEEMEKALKDQKSTYDKDFQELVNKLEKQKEDSASMKTSITAERQVQFNEAVSRVSQEKDKMIEETRQSLLEQTEKVSSLLKEKEVLERQVGELEKKLEQREEEHKCNKRKQEDEMSLLKQKLTQLQQQILAKSEIAVTPPDVKEGASVVAIDQKTSELELALKSKADEVDKLQQRVMELSMTASTRSFAQDKVSITSCNVGDLVLLCLDERHDQYVVFTIGTTLHFLHTECLDPLGLKTGPGETRRSWVLAEIIDKEYCQAKKPQNRFKVPVGTKFYRVKAKMWSREPSHRESSTKSSSATAQA